jgi:acetylornithine deacetylase/succinyl-diaminopimelate desuccinylase-like protein
LPLDRAERAGRAAAVLANARQRNALEHFQALVRLDTSSPPGNETRAAEYLKGVLDKEGISAQILALEPDRANLVARLNGNGTKRPLRSWRCATAATSMAKAK